MSSWLTDRHAYLLAVIFYGVSMIYSFFLWRKGFREDNRINFILLLTAFVCNMTAMYLRGATLARCPITNIYEAMTFVTWAIVGVYMVVGAWARLRFLGAFASPFLFAIGVLALMPEFDKKDAPTVTSGLTHLHAALILLSYGAFGLSSIAGLMYLTQERNLKFNKMAAVFSLMPPIERLDKVMTRLLVAGFILLTAGLSLVPFVLKQTSNVYFSLEIKLIWSFFVWALYLTLIIMHWKFSQSGRRFAYGAIGSFVFVLLTFWGSTLLSPAHQQKAHSEKAVINRIEMKERERLSVSLLR